MWYVIFILSLALYLLNLSRIADQQLNQLRLFPFKGKF